MNSAGSGSVWCVMPCLFSPLALPAINPHVWSLDLSRAAPLLPQVYCFRQHCGEWRGEQLLLALSITRAQDDKSFSPGVDWDKVDWSLSALFVHPSPFHLPLLPAITLSCASLLLST